MRAFAIFFVALCASSSVSADQAQCKKAVEAADIAALQRNCAYLREAKLSYLRAVYYNVLGSIYSQKHLLGLDPSISSRSKGIETYTKALNLLAESERKSEKIKAFDIISSKLNSYRSRGMLYLNQEPGNVASLDADKALQDFNMAISLDSRDADLYLHRGFAHNQLLKANDAWEDFKKAKALDPNNSSILNAYEKQRKIMPEGQADLLKLDNVRKGGPDQKGGADQRK